MLLRVARAEAPPQRAVADLRARTRRSGAPRRRGRGLWRSSAKIGEFRGESRFTTWACKFVIFEVSGKIGRHFWRHPAVPLEAGDWDRLPDRFGLDPARESEWRDLARALRRAVEEELTEHQRRVFTAIVVDGVPLDALVAKLGSSRNALYKTRFDARRKLRPASSPTATCTRPGEALMNS